LSEAYDLVVLGTGSAASTAPRLAREQGWSVAVVDSRPFGGTCALRGCDPKKALVEAAQAVDRVWRMEGDGVVAGGAALAWADLMRFKRTFTDPVPEEKESGLREMEVETIHGRARFVGERTIEVDGRRLEAKKVLIATGARPATLDIPGEELLTSSAGFLDLDELPPRIVFVGGGYIAFEFAHLAVRAGAEVAVLHRGERPLERFEPELVDRLAAVTREVGIDLRVEHDVEAIERSGDGLRVHASTLDGSRVFDADLVVHAAGRAPEIDDLDLDAAGIERGQRGVRVDRHFRSVSNEAVYAAGDAAGTDGLPLTPVAGQEGQAAAHNLVLGERRTVDYAGLPTVVFSIPPMTLVGMSEREAREAGIDLRIVQADHSDWASARRRGARAAMHKVLIDRGSDRIVGAHLLGEGAPEIINLFAIAVRHDVTAGDLENALYAYPTDGSNLPYMVRK